MTKHNLKILIAATRQRIAKTNDPEEKADLELQLVDLLDQLSEC